MHHRARDEQLAHAAVRLRHHLAGAAVLLAAVRVRNLLQLYQRKAGFKPDQPRDDIGRWTDAGGNPVAGRDDPRVLSDANPDDAWRPGAQLAGRQGGRSGGSQGTTAREVSHAAAVAHAHVAASRVRQLDPTWRPPKSFSSTIEGQIAHHQAVARAAEARLADILRDAIPNTNPSWGVNRLRAELSDQGYVLLRPARDPGLIFANQRTGEEVRIMQRPAYGPGRNETRQKFYNDYYYRYRSGRDQEWGNAITIPNK